jgi:hypothetical protein
LIHHGVTEDTEATRRETTNRVVLRVFFRVLRVSVVNFIEGVKMAVKGAQRYVAP